MTALGNDRLRWRWLAAVPMAVGVASLLWVFLLNPSDSFDRDTVGGTVAWVIAFTSSLVVGLVLSVRRPHNVFGWMMLTGSSLVVSGLAAEDVAGDLSGDLIVAAGLVVLVGGLALFPNGRSAGRFWRLAHLLALALFLIPVTAPVGAAAGLLSIAGSLTHRMIRGDHLERRQLAVPLYGLSVGILSFPLLAALLDGTDEWFFAYGVGVVVVLFSISVGVAVLRYRLYEIDRIISRTLGYALVVGVLGLVYGLGAVWLPTRLVGDEVPAVFVAGSTLLVIVLFNPVRRRLLGWVDRRFYRSRYDAVRVAEEFGGRVKDRVDVDGLAVDWMGVVSETMQPRTVGVWVRQV